MTPCTEPLLLGHWLNLQHTHDHDQSKSVATPDQCFETDGVKDTLQTPYQYRVCPYQYPCSTLAEGKILTVSKELVRESRRFVSEESNVFLTLIVLCAAIVNIMSYSPLAQTQFSVVSRGDAVYEVTLAHNKHIPSATRR